MLTKRPMQDIMDEYYKSNHDILEILKEVDVDKNLTEHEAIVIYLAAYISVKDIEIELINKSTGESLLLNKEDFITDHFFFTGDKILDLLLHQEGRDTNCKSYSDIINSYKGIHLKKEG